VVAIGPDGRVLGQFGRAGEGPGEFGDPRQLDILPGGRIVVTDMRRRTFHLFDPEGAFERGVRVALDMPDLDLLLQNALYWGRAAVFGARPAREGAAIFSDGIRKVMRTDLSSDEARIETFVEAWAPPGTEEKFGSLAEVTGGGVWGFVPPLVFDALPGGGIAYSDSSTYAVKVTGPAGQMSRILRRPIAPRPVTDRLKRAEIDRQLAELSRAAVLGGELPVTARAMRAGFRSGQAQAIEDMQSFRKCRCCTRFAPPGREICGFSDAERSPTWTLDRSTCSRRPAAIRAPLTGGCGCRTSSAPMASSPSSNRTSSMCRSSR